MLSLATAKKLRDAGFRWRPWFGDQYYIDLGNGIPSLNNISGTVVIADATDIGYAELCLQNKEDCPVFAPRLDQLLAEIEKRGYRWDIGNLGFFRDDDVCIGLFDEETREYVAQFLGVMPEEVAALALIWILEREKGGRPDDQA